MASNKDPLLSAKKIKNMVEGYSRKSGYPLYPDADRVKSILEGLTSNYLKYGKPYCPCRPEKMTRENICPCASHKEDIERTGMCECALFVSASFRP